MSESTQAPRPSATLQTFGPPITLILLIIATAICQRLRGGAVTFLSVENFRNILADWSFVGIIALGMTFVIISGGIDLSVGSLVAFAGGAGIWMMNTVIGAVRIRQEMGSAGDINLPLPYSYFRLGLAQLFIHLHLAGSERAGVLVAVVVSISLGLGAGIVNGLLVVRGRIAPFIATLGGLAAYRSLAMAMIDGGTFDSQSPDLFHRLAGSGIAIPGIHIGGDLPLIVPYPVLVFFILAAVMAVLLNKMRFGRYIFAIGSNERASRYSGVNVERIKILAYVLIGALTGISALLVASHTNSVSSSTTGELYELDVIAAVVVGGTRMTGGAGTIFGTVIGVLILGVIGNMLNFLDVSVYLQGLVKGGIIVAAAFVQQVGQKETS
ncbi:MAG TPA: ABC transporter permease [Tepidisphaeraceae bacterium]|jgi:ribose transport system permease protein|nr:ABC transporter permease [Tepidisphaeraceae bacterium]